MNISKFVLIDVALVIVLVLLLPVVQGGKKQSSLFRRMRKEDLVETTSINLLDKNRLIALEEIAKSRGSGIEFDSLVGNWKFISVWKKDSDEEDSVFSSLLRIFSANLEIKEVISSENPFIFSIITSIQFGLFSIEFIGSAYLKGNQPLLPFFFRKIELKSGSSILLSRSLKEPVVNGKSFFELIALEDNGSCLSARVQGGSLVLWLKD